MNEERMSKKPVIVSDRSITELRRIPLSGKVFQESWMQELLANNPSVLPTGFVDGIFSPLVFIGREIEVESGFIDNLYVSAKGYLVIVETKLWRNPEAKRQVVSQILDYAKDLKKWNYAKLDLSFRASHSGKKLFQEMCDQKYYDSDDESYFVDVVEHNISKARFLLMVVGDGIREDVEKMTAFLNESVNLQYQFALCELEVYEMEDGKRLVVPQLTTKTKIITRTLFESASTSDSIKEPLLVEDTTEKKRKFVNAEDWAENTFSDNSKADPNEVVGIINDMVDIGYSYHVGTSDLTMELRIPSTNKTALRFWFFGNGESACIQPSHAFDLLEKAGYSPKLAEPLLDDLRPFLIKNQKNIPYQRKEGYYYISFETMTQKKNEFLQIFEKFKSNFF